MTFNWSELNVTDILFEGIKCQLNVTWQVGVSNAATVRTSQLPQRELLGRWIEIVADTALDTHSRKPLPENE